ncbi:unnamed protein product [Discula destructiva]
MDPDSQYPVEDAGAAQAAMIDAELRRDPPPRPNSILDTPEEEDQLDGEVDAWLARNGNGDYVRSWDPRYLRPMPVLSRLWGYNEEWYRTRLFGLTLHHTRVAGRRFSPSELAIFSMHASRGIVAASYDRPVALGVTALFLWRGAATFRLPGYQPRFVRFTHPQLTRLPWLSTLAWHGTRVGAYGAVGFAAYYLLASRYRTYMVDVAIDECLSHELGLKTLVAEMSVNLDRFNQEQRTRGRLSGQRD